MGRHVVGFLALLLLAAPLRAQSLSERLGQLFVLGSWSAPLQVGQPVESGTPGTGVAPNDAFLPAAGTANLAVLGFLVNWMSGNVAATPLGTAFGGVTFTFEAGMPNPMPVSPGPLVGERAQTLGRGRLVLGANLTGIQFTSVRGVPMDDIHLNFTHVNLDSPECDAAEGRDCAPLGVPEVENDIIELRLGVDMDLTMMALSLTYGLTDRIDVGAVLPIVHADLNGTSRAQVIPFTSAEGPARTFIAGTPESPVLTSTQHVEGSATGIGDIALRAKVNLFQRGWTGVALLGDVRLATGDEEDFLGAGHTAFRTLGVFSTRFGGFSPHASLRYLTWSAETVNDGILATLGFDQVLPSWVTLATSFVSEFQVGESVYQVPDPVTITEPVPRVVQPLELPDIRDDALSTAIGFKFMTRSGITALVNALFPVRRGGPRPDFAWSVGAEYDF